MKVDIIMKKWIIPVGWEVYATIEVEAETLEEAIEIAVDDDGEIPLPTDNGYVDGSWKVEGEYEYIRDCFNDGDEV